MVGMLAILALSEFLLRPCGGSQQLTASLRCTAQPPDRAQIYDQTWHDNTRGANQAEIWFQSTFTGTSVTVYGILIDIIATGFVTNVDLTLNLDGVISSYTYTPVSRNSYQYQVPVFTKTGLSNTQHTIRVTLNPNSVFLVRPLMNYP
jgi:hypothetical protein